MDFTSLGALLEPWLKELGPWRKTGGVHPEHQGIKLYRLLKVGTLGRSIADNLTIEQISSDKGLDLLIQEIKSHFAGRLEAAPEVSAEVALYKTERSDKQTFT